MDRATRFGNKTKLRLSAKRKKRGAYLKIWHMSRSAQGTSQQHTKNKDISASNVLTEICEKNIERASTSHDVQTLFIESQNAEQNEEVSEIKIINDEYLEGKVSSNANDELHGRRIVDFQFLFQQLQKLDNHFPGCNIQNLHICNEIRSGFDSTIDLKCDMCNMVFPIRTTDNQESDINISAVTGILNIGCGYTHMKNFTGFLNIPCMTPITFQKYHNTVSDAVEKESFLAMREAALEEKELAIAEGNIDQDGVPLVTVVCDGSWSKRSYKTKYNALSGAASIIGYKTKKVLWMSIKNRYCMICARAKNANVSPKQHKCYKNHEGSASSIEATGIVEGFCNSEQQYGIRYNEVIADGDSSVMKRLVETRPYKNTKIIKIECRNHLLRNYCNKIRELCKTTKAGPAKLRQALQAKLLKLRSAVTKAILHRKEENVELQVKIDNLKLDILNSPSHVFGEHKCCLQRGYFCKESSPSDNNLIPQFQSVGLHEQLMTFVRYLANHAQSLIFDVDSNSVEQFHAVIAKFIAGKRINYTQRRSYNARCGLAILSKNSEKPFHTIHKKICGKSPGKIAKSIERKKPVRIQRKCKKKITFGNENDRDYGANCEKVLSSEQLEEAKTLYITSMIRSEAERNAVEERTRNQADCREWTEIRKNLLTASNFGKVCKMMPHTSCKNIVFSLLYSPPLKNIPSLQYGIKFEPVAICEFSKQYNIKVRPCGLFLDEHIPYLGASPDGLIDTDGIIEVKCPSSAQNLTPEEAINQKKVLFWKRSFTNGTDYQINQNSIWYYQVQGQLHIARKQYCWFIVWTPFGIKCEKILKDEQFWISNMVEKLTAFYTHCLLPEIICGNKSKTLIKDPEYILAARLIWQEKKILSNKNKLERKNTKDMKLASIEIEEIKSKRIVTIQDSGDSDSDDNIPLAKRIKM